MSGFGGAYAPPNPDMNGFPDRAGEDPQKVVEIWVTAGPDAGWSVALPLGRHLVGRAMGCAVAIADPAIEAHHALLEIDEDGVELVQLAGRLPVRVATTHLEIGDTRLDLSPPATASGLVMGVTICDPLTGCLLYTSPSPRD